MGTTNSLLKVFTPYSTLAEHKGYYVGACPLCNSRPPKMVVRPDQGAWHCYSCSTGGDAVDFLQAVERLSRDQALLLYNMLVQDGGAPAGAGDIDNTPASVSAAPGEEPATPVQEPADLASTAVAPTVAEEGTLADLRERVGSVDGFRGIAYFGVNGKALLVDNLKAEELVPINAYFDGAFKAAQSLLGSHPVPTFEGVLRDETTKFIRFDAPVAGSRCRIFLALGAEASEARFRFVVQNFLAKAKSEPR